MANKDYYEVLGIARNASKDDIKKAFRKLAHQYHPDKTRGDAAAAQKFKEASEAYAILSDDKKRAEYDAYGRTFAGGAGPGAGFGGFDFSGFGNGQGFDFSNFAGGFGQNSQQDGFEFDLGDLFGDFFGGRRSGERQSNRGRDISIDIELSFAESIFGGGRKVLLAKTAICDVCQGSGGKPGTELIQCAVCNGKGKIRETRRSFIGNFTTVRVCDACGGRGKAPKEKCPSCRGAGALRKEQEISITIPPGIDDGEMIRLSGQGEAVPGGAPGDLYVKVHVKKHPLFRKEGANLVADMNVKLSSALLGEEFLFQTLDGEIKVKIPEGVSVGEVLRIRGKGVPYDKGKRGDLLIRLHITMPAKLSKEARKALEDLKREGV